MTEETGLETREYTSTPETSTTAIPSHPDFSAIPGKAFTARPRAVGGWFITGERGDLDLLTSPLGFEIIQPT